MNKNVDNVTTIHLLVNVPIESCVKAEIQVF